MMPLWTAIEQQTGLGGVVQYVHVYVRIPSWAGLGGCIACRWWEHTVTPVRLLCTFPRERSESARKTKTFHRTHTHTDATHKMEGFEEVSSHHKSRCRNEK